jgi:hypothetical protein
MAVQFGGKLVPSVSAKQEKFMQAVANNPKFAKKVGVPTSVGREFTKKEGTKMKYAKGGMTASKMGAVKTAAPSKDGVAMKGKTKGKKVVMAGGKGMKAGGMTKMRNGGKC